jgi:hypothetical protein
MRTGIAAALGLAAGLIAAPAFAQEPTTRGVHPVTPPAASATSPTPAAPAATPHRMVHHRMVMHRPMVHHPMMHTAAAPRSDAEHMTIEQLNNMSLQAAKKGQNFTPPPGR